MFTEAALALLAYNVAVALLYGADKWKAGRGTFRVPERTLLGAAACFGSLGAFVAMRAFRHKTRKPAFRVGVPLLVIVHGALLAWLGARLIRGLAEGC